MKILKYPVKVIWTKRIDCACGAQLEIAESDLKYGYYCFGECSFYVNCPLCYKPNWLNDIPDDIGLEPYKRYQENKSKC